MRLAGLCKGSTADSDSVCEGSNPSPAAKGKQFIRRDGLLFCALFSLHLFRTIDLCVFLSKIGIEMCKFFGWESIEMCFPGVDLLNGEVDYLIDDYDSLSAVPIEVKSGKDYTIHSALSVFVKNENYHVKKAYVLSNTREITTNGKITYIPIYDVMFLGATAFSSDTLHLN